MFRQIVDKPNENVSNEVITSKLNTLTNALSQTFIITVLNGDGEIIDVNENFVKTFNYSLSELTMQDHWILNSGYHSEEFLAGIWSIVQLGEKWSGELCQRAKNGDLIWLKSTFIPIQNEGERPSRVLVISSNNTNQKELEKWKHLASHHELTNLPNRRMLTSSLESYIARAKRKDMQLAIFYMDINFFKSINDNYGHLIGDLLLREVGIRLSSLPTLKNCVFHVSGDEFVLLIKDIASLEAHVQSVFDLFNKSFIIEKHEIKASVSVGMSIYPNHGTDPKLLIKYADLAMFESKKQKQSGNCFREYGSSTGM